MASFRATCQAGAQGIETGKPFRDSLASHCTTDDFNE